MLFTLNIPFSFNELPENKIKYIYGIVAYVCMSHRPRNNIPVFACLQCSISSLHNINLNRIALVYNSHIPYIHLDATRRFAMYSVFPLLAWLGLLTY